MSNLFDGWGSQPAPYSQEAEEATIGAVITFPPAYFGVAAFLQADDFFLLRHRYIWQAMQRLVERDEPIEYVTLSKELDDLGKLDEIGGPAYLTHLINSAPSAMHAEVYGRLVERAATRRRLMAASDQIKALALNEELAIEQVIADAEARLFDVTERQLTKELVPMREAISAYYDRIEHLMRYQDEALGLPTGFKDLDKLLGGLQKSDLIIFAGRPGMGKTSFMLSAAVNMARLGARIAIFSMEMGVEQIVQRLVSMEAAINSQNLRTGQLTNQEWGRFVRAAGTLSSFRVFIDDTPAMNPIQMRTKCFRLAREHGLDLVIVDYMQLMNAGGAYSNNRVQEISFISRSLKEMARELNVPVLSAAQLSRAVEQRQDKRPVLSDLRESGCLTGDTLIYLPDSGCYVPIAELCGRVGFRVMSLNTETWKLEPSTVTNAFCTGTKPVYRLTTQLGRTIRATANHRFLTIHGWKRLDELTPEDHIALPRRLNRAASVLRAVNLWRLFDLTPQPPLHMARGSRALRGGGEVSKTQSETYQTRLLTSSASNMVIEMAESDVYWDAIISLEPEGEAQVYDLTVPGNQCFVANDIVAHNSIEQDSDIVIFLYRDEVYNEATEFPNQADLIISKHRNGPTGTVSLYFEKTLTKFMNAAERSVDLSRI